MIDQAPAANDFEQTALATLDVGRVLLQCGARAQVVRSGCRLVALGLGADLVEARPGYASIDVTVQKGAVSITRMGSIGAIGVNHRLDQAVRRLAKQAGSMTPAALLAELARIEREVPRYPPWLAALAAGLACASFGMLIGTDFLAFPMVALGAAIGQQVRHSLMHRSVNVFVVATVVALVAASIGASGAAAIGSTTAYSAMIASVLLLVPGVPALNAQSDIIEGNPTLGSARAVSVAMVLIFVAVGVGLAQAITGVQP